MSLWNWPPLRALALLRRSTRALESLAQDAHELLLVEKRRMAREFPEKAKPRPVEIGSASVEDFMTGYKAAHPELYPEEPQ